MREKKEDGQLMPNSNELLRFEKWIKRLITKGIIKIPASDETVDRVMNIDFKARLLSTMRNAMDKRDLIIHKLKEPKTTNSLGEYLNYLIEHDDLNIKDISDEIDLDLKIISKLRNESIHPENIPVPKLANLIEYLRISVEDAYCLLDKSIVLFHRMQAGEMLNSYSRTDTKIKDSKRDTLLDNAMKELITKIASEKKDNDAEQMSFTFKEDLKRELLKRDYHV